MEQIRRIIANPAYRECLTKNEAAENDRIFCTHHFEHLLATARLTYILILEEGCPFISREMAYAAGLLHDIGRWCEYWDGTDHAKASAELAEPILLEAGFSENESRIIKQAIAQHRLKGDCCEHRSLLSAALSRADSLSRNCFSCKVREQCRKFGHQPNQETLLY